MWDSKRDTDINRLLGSVGEARVGWFDRIALKHVYYHMWNRMPIQVLCMRQGDQGCCTGITLRDGMGREDQDGEHVYTHGLFMWMYGKVQFSSVIQSCPTLCDTMNRSTPGLPVHHQLRSSLRLTSIESVMPYGHLIFRRSLLLLPPIPPSIRVFSNESTLHVRWPKYWSFSFSSISSKEIPGLISFRMDWLDLLAVQRTLKSLLKHHSSKASILQCSAFFTVQISQPYMTTGKTIALTRWTLVGKVMSLLFNMLSRLVITFLPRSKHLLYSGLQSPSAVILEPQKIKADTVSTVSPSISHEVMGPNAMIFVFWMLSFKPTFPSPLLLSSGGFLVPLHFLP